MIKSLIGKYKHAFLMLGYACLYIPWFVYLENTVTKRFHPIHMKIDDFIPFNEYFIVPYLMWFAYVLVILLYLFFKDKTEYFKMCGFIFSGMTIFLIISTVFPNGHYLRPVVFENNNIFTQMVASLYRADTPTNLFPSIHVYNSLGAHFAVMHSQTLSNNKFIKSGSFILCIAIILSTVFLKQHSIFDMITAFIAAAVFYPLVYKIDYTTIAERRRQAEEHYIS